MADTYPYRETLQYVADCCAELFDVETTDLGEPLDAPEEVLANALRDDEDEEGLPQITLSPADPQLVALSRACNGFTLEWQVDEAQRPPGLASDYTSGRTDLLGLGTIYSSWKHELYVESFVNDEDDYYQNIGRHLQRFHVVDQYADYAGTMVGIYHDELPNPELYHYTSGDGELPKPLGVDVQGYLELLKLSLGYLHWQKLLVELNQYFGGSQAEPFVVRGGSAQHFVNDMTRLNPDFTLEKFMARYAEVRLRR